LQLIDIEYPISVEVFLSLFGNLADNPTYDANYDNNNRPTTDVVLDLYKEDQTPPLKFQKKAMNPLFVKGGVTGTIQMIVIY
jgi:hypothetical protein